MNSKVLLWAALFGLLFVSAGAEARAAQAQQEGIIRARGVKGAVTAREKAAPPGVNPVTVTNNMPLRQGMTVTTAANASVVLIFSNGATVNVGSESTLDIDDFTTEGAVSYDSSAAEEGTSSRTKLTLQKGEIVGKVAKLHRDQGSEFTINTPVGAAGIRGTTFRIVYRPAGTGQAFFSLTTVEGNVQVTLASGQVPAPVSVADSQELVLTNVTLNVDNVTGQVTFVLPAGTSAAAQQATAATTQLVLAAVQSIVEATAGVRISVTGVVTENQPTTPTANNAAPPPTEQQNRTTSGDGR